MALFALSWRRLIAGAGVTSGTSPMMPRLSSAGAHHQPRYIEKVGIPEFLKGIGNGVETHMAKLETEIGDIEKLLVTRTLRLKKLGIPCKHRKLILNYAQKYRLGLWRPRADLPKPQAA
ncbi:IGR protein motif-containing protein [Dioscorea alata]|uniref:IGR protein motif-containing protein n=1 Tax=Dioscorea alata TaxID=55571 RepID=A0ACB7VPI1_DIOAL|nr:IGR protein motif-containing protein [Dioscorea alata]